MKKRLPVLISFIIVCIFFTGACASDNKNAADSSLTQPADDASASFPNDDPAPVMTPVRNVPDSSLQNSEGSEPDDISDNISENVSGDTDSDPASDGIDGDPASGDDNSDDVSGDPPAQAGIFTSSGITDEIKVRITGKSYAEGCTVPYEDLRYLQLSYVDFNGETQLGEMICNKAIAADLIEIFSELYHEGYQIDKIRLIDDYNADDDASCDDDNTSCFNYRVVAGSTNLSKHAQGVAVDLNPFYNPYVTYPNGKIRISPVGSEAYADRSSDFPHKIDENDLAYKLFTKHGFTWGGHWKTLKDYQHFQKPL